MTKVETLKRIADLLMSKEQIDKQILQVQKELEETLNADSTSAEIDSKRLECVVMFERALDLSIEGTLLIKEIEKQMNNE